MKFSTFLKRSGFRKMTKSEVGNWDCYQKEDIFVEINDYVSWENVFVIDGKETYTFNEVEDLERFLNEVKP